MSTTIGSTTSSSANGGTNANGSPILGKNDFLKLLVTQMQHQDPLNPTDNTQFVAQLAQFSSVEQMTNVNDTLTQLLTAQAGANQLGATSLVGKTVQTSSNTVALGTSGPVAIGGTLSGTAANVTATITDSSGKVIRTIHCGPGAGNFTSSWDGKSDSGTTEPAGTYTVALTAVDASGNPITASTTSTGVVTGISFVNGAAQLVVNGQTIPLSAVQEIDLTPPK